MPLFDYVCPKGHHREVTIRADHILCGSDCSEIARRRFSFAIKSSIPAHYNHSVGAYVRNEQDMRDHLKRAAESQATRLGYETEFEYIPPGDLATQPATFGVTEEGLDETRRRHHDAEVAGITPEEHALRETISGTSVDS